MRSLSSVEKDFPAEKDVEERTMETEDGIWYQTPPSNSMQKKTLLTTQELCVQEARSWQGPEISSEFGEASYYDVAVRPE